MKTIWEEYEEAQRRHRRAWAMFWASKNIEEGDFAIAGLNSSFKVVRAYEALLGRKSFYAD